jgi:predicted transcriptional regulator
MADTFSIRLPDDLRAEIDKIAESTQRSRAFIIKEAVEAYVDEHRDYLNAIDEAIAEADKGVFISGKAARQWMRDLRTNPKAPAPKPDVFKK